VGLVPPGRPRGRRPCRSGSPTRSPAWRPAGGSERVDRAGDSAAARLISLLPALPVLSAPTARGAIGVSQQQTLAALKALAKAGVLRQISTGTYHRQYVATELFDLLTAYEARVVGEAR
jgi:hypothetical protein